MGPVEGRSVERVVGLEGIRAEVAMMQTPDGNGRLELAKFHSPSTRATTGTPSYRLRYVRGPEGTELAKEIG
jgi:hypothetical protein